MGGDLINQTAPAKVIVFNFPYEAMLLYLEDGTFNFEDGEQLSSDDIHFYCEQGFKVLHVEEGQITRF